MLSADLMTGSTTPVSPPSTVVFVALVPPLPVSGRLLLLANILGAIVVAVVVLLVALDTGIATVDTTVGGTVVSFAIIGSDVLLLAFVAPVDGATVVEMVVGTVVAAPFVAVVGALVPGGIVRPLGGRVMLSIAGVVRVGAEVEGIPVTPISSIVLLVGKAVDAGGVTWVDAPVAFIFGAIVNGAVVVFSEIGASVRIDTVGA